MHPSARQPALRPGTPPRLRRRRPVARARRAARPCAARPRRQPAPTLPATSSARAQVRRPCSPLARLVRGHDDDAWGRLWGSRDGGVRWCSLTWLELDILNHVANRRRCRVRDRRQDRGWGGVRGQGDPREDGARRGKAGEPEDHAHRARIGLRSRGHSSLPSFASSPEPAGGTFRWTVIVFGGIGAGTYTVSTWTRGVLDAPSARLAA